MLINKKIESVPIETNNIVRFREKRLKIVTASQGRVIIKDMSGEQIESQLLDISRFGARISAPKDTLIQTNYVYANCTIMIQETRVYEGAISLVNEKRLDDTTVSFGVAFEGNGIDIDRVDAILTLQDDTSILTATKQTLELAQIIKPEFKILVADLNTLFQDLKLRLHEEDLKINEMSKTESQKARLQEQIVTLALSLYATDIHRIFGQFKVLTETFDFDTSVVHKRYFRANFHPIVLGSPFVARGYNKPLGYAGDFGLMIMLYEYADQGGNLFEKFFHRFSCNEPAAVANKNRVDYLCETLIEEYSHWKNQSTLKKFKVTSLACGPAKELELFMQKIDNKHGLEIQLVCADNESLALEYAQQRIRPMVGKKNNASVIFHKEDVVLGLIKEKKFCEDIKDSNFIISAGLFDYLSDRVATKLLDAMYSLLAPGGKIIVGNVSKSNPDRFSMDYFTEWQLILRSKDDLTRLIPEHIKNNTANHITVVAESLDINLFLVIQKN